jgi:hypothetical protein
MFGKQHLNVVECLSSLAVVMVMQVCENRDHLTPVMRIVYSDTHLRIAVQPV